MKKRIDVQEALAQIRTRVGRRGIVAAVVLLLALLAAVATPQLLGHRVAEALGTLRDADPKWLWLAGVGVATSVLAAAACWRTVIELCGGRIGITDACARYGAGSLVNTFVPARAGDAVRIALFSRALPGKGRLWTTSGAFAALGAARALVLGILVVVGAAVGLIPAWPLLIVGGVVALAVVAAILARKIPAHLLDAFRALGADWRASGRLIGWVALSTTGRLIAATAVAAALGIEQPIGAAVVIVLALDVASIVPITPGNLGVTSAAIATALQAHGASFNSGLAAGIAFHAVELAVGIMYGVASVLWLAPYPSPNARRIALLAGAGSWVLGIAGAFSATVLVPLV
jgi:uncharacterized membrane protein YbhN (UPF0104 family)